MTWPKERGLKGCLAADIVELRRPSLLYYLRLTHAFARNCPPAPEIVAPRGEIRSQPQTVGKRQRGFHARLPVALGLPGVRPDRPGRGHRQRGRPQARPGPAGILREA